MDDKAESSNSAYADEKEEEEKGPIALSKSEGETVFERVQEFIMSDNLEKQFEDFADEHADTFMQALDLEPGEEHPLEFHSIYREYLERFEGKIERFIVSEGMSSMAFYKECEKILDNDDVFDMKRFFVETLLSTSEYEAFFDLMRGEMSRIKATAQRK